MFSMIGSPPFGLPLGAVIDLKNPQEELLPGMTAYVTIPTGQASKAVEVPNAALRFVRELPLTSAVENAELPSADLLRRAAS